MFIIHSIDAFLFTYPFIFPFIFINSYSRTVMGCECPKAAGKLSIPYDNLLTCRNHEKIYDLVLWVSSHSIPEMAALLGLIQLI